MGNRNAPHLFPDLAARLGWASRTPTISETVRKHAALPNAADPDAAAAAWAECGFAAGEVDAWLKARCFDPGVARELADLGMSPKLAATKTSAGAGHLVDTVGFKVCDSQLEIGEACTLLGLH